MLKKLQRLTTSSRVDQKKVINEAHELALQENQKEPNINYNNNNNNNKSTATNTFSYNNNKSKEQQQQQQPHQQNKDAYHITNKTDEEKEVKVKNQQLTNNFDNNSNERNEEANIVEEDEDEEEEEARISKEPIYENISATSMQQVDIDATIKNISTQIIIPQKNNQQIINDENNKENILKIINNHNHNNEKLINENNNNYNNNNPNKNTKISSQNSTNYNHIGNNNIDIRNAKITTTSAATATTTYIEQKQKEQPTSAIEINEPFYQVPKSIMLEPYYDAPKNLRPVPVYENIDVFYNGIDINSMSNNNNNNNNSLNLVPPKEKPPPPPIESPTPFDETDCIENGDTWSSDNTYETISARLPTSAHQRGLLSVAEHPSPPIKRINSTKRIKKELRNKRSSFLGIEGTIDDDETFLELALVPPPDMAQLLQEERRLEKQLYLKAAGLCDSSDTGESRDSGVSENHSRQSSEHYTNSSEENDHPRLIETPPLKSTDMMYESDAMIAAQTPLLQTVKGDCAEAWTESATVAAAATKSLTEATATANAKMLCIEEKIREQEEVLRVERELLQLEQEELKRQRENLMFRENMARRELQHGAKMLMSANRHSLQDLNAGAVYSPPLQQQQTQPIVVLPKLQNSQQQQQQLIKYQQVQEKMPQQIYANLPNNNKQIPQVPQTFAPAFYEQVQTDYRKSMSDINEFTKRSALPPIPPTKPLRAMHVVTNGNFSNSLVKIATPTAAPRAVNIYSNYGNHHQSVQNLPQLTAAAVNSTNNTMTAGGNPMPYGNMTRNTLHALSATPKPKYTDGWVQIQQQQNYQQKRKSLPETAFHQSAASYNNHWLVQEAEHRRITAEQRRSSIGSNLINAAGSKPLPDSIIQTLTERVQSKGIGERSRLEKMSANNSHNNNTNNSKKCPLQQQITYATNGYGNNDAKTSPQKNHITTTTTGHNSNNNSPKSATTTATTPPQEKMLSVSGKKKCSHCGEELGRGAAMIIESLLLFYHINCFKCCVCHVQLGDGLNGTDVRVRNNKLHCQNCYSSDDGIKFSCV